jgi:phosphoglycerol transferase MdoB-like AlkP superfamily enzyme
MRALALLVVFIIAKLMILAGHSIQLSSWTPIAYFWQDIVIALLFALADGAVRWSRLGRSLGWTLYGVFVAYAAINVPIARVLSTPLTWPMLDAARGALSNSITHHATAANLLLMFLVLASGTALPFLLRRVKLKGGMALILPGFLVVPIGQVASSRVEAIGLDRNAIMALVTTALPRISGHAPNPGSEEDWRASLANPTDDGAAGQDLSRWRGAAAGRNVVLILLESAGAGYLLPYGSNRDPMPNLSQLASGGIIFDNAYSVYPESIKELFSVLCSRYPAMDTATEEYAWITTPSLPSRLREEGYRTALFHSGRFMYLGMYAVVSNRGYEVLEDAGAIGGNYESSFGVDEPSTVERALGWIDTLGKDERFFMTYLPVAGHHPYDTPEPGPFPEQAESDRYLNALHYADAALGSLIEGVRDRGLYERTLFVIFGDHGQAFGQHEGNYGHSLFLYEENIRVPYLIVAPGLINEQTRIERTISLIDTAPTILDLLGSPSPPDYQGRTALESKPSMALFYTDYSLGLIGLRDERWKYIYELDSERSKLFDLRQDASESNNLSHIYAELVASYRARAIRWSTAQKALITNNSGE